MNEPITIMLPSLIHRIGRENVTQAQTLAKSYGCQLKRVRRSRNWQICGGAIDIQSFIKQLVNFEGFRYLTQKIETALLQHSDKLESIDAKLIRLIDNNPSITLAELMELTQCTITEARLARFQTDSW